MHLGLLLLGNGLGRLLVVLGLLLLFVGCGRGGLLFLGCRDLLLGSLFLGGLLLCLLALDLELWVLVLVLL